ncbi:MAG: tRNA pseudouridine(38-40) synthase TruA [Planctomycetota bacterium]|nr:MAG: tRNA pseudouridine(38-40) synthase TruA [Planctomycetota bacterium]
MDVRHIRLKIAYDGTDFSGWQTQPGLPTIQDSIESALERMTGQRPKLVGSGRTDAGVHAHAQIASFYTVSQFQPVKFQNALNAFLPDTIRILDSDEVPIAFHPTLDVISKRYRYSVDNDRYGDPMAIRYAYHVGVPLNETEMVKASRYLVGRHDFAAFQTSGSERVSTVRRVFACEVMRLGSNFQIEVEANGFLYNMVRTIAGTLIMVGKGKWQAHQVQEILDSCDRRKAGPTASARGLAMLWVNYDQPRGIR